MPRPKGLAATSDRGTQNCSKRWTTLVRLRPAYVIPTEPIGHCETDWRVMLLSIDQLGLGLDSLQ